MSIAEKHATITANNDAIMDSIQRVYDVGYTKGQAAGGEVDTDVFYQKGVEDGRAAERSDFWDTFQMNGTRTKYSSHVFSSGSFGFDNFYPKYDIKPEGESSYLFYNWNASINPNGNLRQRLDDCKVSLDTSKVTNFVGAFSYGRFTELPGIDARTMTSSNNQNLFANNYTYLKKIGTVKVCANTILTGWFTNDTRLKEITFDGEIGQSVNFQWCPLSIISMKNIISHLKNFTDTGNENTKTLTFSDACWAALEADSTAPDGGTWKDYVTETLCWNV